VGLSIAEGYQMAREQGTGVREQKIEVMAAPFIRRREEEMLWTHPKFATGWWSCGIGR